MRRLHTLPAITLGMILAASARAQAPDVFRSTDAEGRVTYSDQIPPGTRAVRRLIARGGAGSAEPVRPEGVDARPADRTGQIAAAELDYRSAYDALTAAQRRLRSGSQILESELATQRSGASADSYFARQVGLRNEVERAERRLLEAERRLAELRDTGS